MTPRTPDPTPDPEPLTIREWLDRYWPIGDPVAEGASFKALREAVVTRLGHIAIPDEKAAALAARPSPAEPQQPPVADLRAARIETAARRLRVETFGRAENDDQIAAAWDGLKDALDSAALRDPAPPPQPSLDALPEGLRLYGLDVEQIKRAIDIADLWQPQWRASRLTSESAG